MLESTLHKCNGVVLATATKSGEREEGGAGNLGEDFLGAGNGLFDDYD